MADVTVARFSFEGEKFEILVKPDPALSTVWKKKDTAILVSEDIYTDSEKEQSLQLKNSSSCNADQTEIIK